MITRDDIKRLRELRRDQPPMWTWTDFFIGVGVGGAIGAVIMALVAGSC